MKEEVKFYRCPVCGNVIILTEKEASHVTCCGKPVEELVANTTDAAVEKHVPVYEKVGDKIIVKVGEVEHPMEEEHYITWIAQVAGDRITQVKLSPAQKTETQFDYIPGATLYAYCNKHGLWKTEVK